MDDGGPPFPVFVTQVRVDHLLTHSAGGWGTDDPGTDLHVRDHRALIEQAVSHLPLSHCPGTHYAYSNIGFCVLARVVEKLTGRPYAGAVRDTVHAALRHRRHDHRWRHAAGAVAERGQL